MATYAIGDIQGCFHELQHLLTLISYEPNRDQLWFAGDLVNRGPDSLATLRLIKNLSPAPIITLGNHDLHLLALFNGKVTPRPKDTLTELLNAPDAFELCEWLRHQKLFYYDPKLHYALVHAGVAPQWDLAKTLELAHEFETALQGPHYLELLANLYGDQPARWHENLTGWERLRAISNYLTRIRFCDPQGTMNFELKGVVGSQPPPFLPWFAVPNRATKEIPIVFGHWSALRGETHYPNAHALDGGCIWGDHLIAKRLEDGKLFKVKCTFHGLDWRKD